MILNNLEHAAADLKQNIVFLATLPAHNSNSL